MLVNSPFFTIIKRDCSSPQKEYSFIFVLFVTVQQPDSVCELHPSLQSVDFRLFSSEDAEFCRFSPATFPSFSAGPKSHKPRGVGLSPYVMAGRWIYILQLSAIVVCQLSLFCLKWVWGSWWLSSWEGSTSLNWPQRVQCPFYYVIFIVFKC